MSHTDFKKQLRSLRQEITIDAEWKNAQRGILLSKISSQTQYAKGWRHSFVFSLLKGSGMMSMRPLATLSLVFVFIFGGVIASVSASGALPGDALYSMKLAQEKIQVTLVRDENKKTDLKLQLAKKRVQEIREVVKRETDFVKVKQMLEVPLAEYNAAMADITDTVKKKKAENNSQETVTLAKTIREVSKQVEAAIIEAGQSVDEGGQMATDIGLFVDSAFADAVLKAQQTELEAVIAIAEGTEDKVMAQAELQEYINKIDVNSSDENAVVVEEEREESSADVENEIEEVVEDGVVDEEVVETVEAAIEIVPTTTKAVKEEVVAEVKTLLSTGDLEGALRKLAGEPDPTEEIENKESSTETNL
jgi:hypothetical protein